MVDNDIYNNKGKYERFNQNLKQLLNPPDKNDRRRKYWVKNKTNLSYFKSLDKTFKANDLSYIRRLRLFRTFLIACHVFTKDLKNITESKEMEDLMAYAHQVNKSNKSKRDFVTDIKHLWKLLFPEKDQRGRPDPTIIPYVVRHLKSGTDRSKEKLRGDKMSYDEFEKLVQAFADDSRMQCLLTLQLESLGRPQELLYTRIKDVELCENYAKVFISEHGKEGTGFLRCVDSYFYLSKWLNEHPLRDDPNAFLFLNTGRTNRYKQMKPTAANKLIKDRCKRIKLNKPITLYSMKRNGVTFMRLSGSSDIDIQHTARWTSNKQLKTYDLSSQEDSFKIDLIKRGLMKPEKGYKQFAPSKKQCVFCHEQNGIAESFCMNCKRPLDKKVILKEESKKSMLLEYFEKSQQSPNKSYNDIFDEMVPTD